MSNLLKDASILLTPTGYDNGSMNAIKPENGDGDFTFSRNSAATRVNAQGLVENVQILSSNLVSNGDFSQEGSELVTGTNSDMSGANSWVGGIGSLDFNINTTVPNKMWCNFTSGNQQVKLDNVITANKTYLVSLSARLNSGTATTVQIGNFSSSQSDAGILNITPTATTTTYSGYIVSGANVNLSIGIITANNNGSDYEFDNISVKEVGQDWTLGSGWSIGEDKAISDGSGFGALSSSYSNFNSKKLKVNFDILNYVSGEIRVPPSYRQDGLDIRYSANGSYELIYDSINSAFALNTVNFNGSVTNISVIEITDDTNLPRINYEGFSYQDSLGSEEIVNGDFSTDSDWIKGSGWTISGGKANASATTGQLYQGTTTTINTQYKIEYTISNYVSGSYNFLLRGTSTATFSGNGTFTVYITSGSGGNSNFIIDGVSSFTGSIDNVSVKEVLGQEVVPNSGCGSWLLEPQSTNLITQSELFSDSAWTKKVNASITSNVVISPNGTLNSDTITWTTSGGTTQLYQVKNITGTSQSLSIFIKYISGSGTNFLFSIGSAVEKGINLTFTNNGAALTGVAGVDVTSYKIEDYENNWFRVSFTANYANSNCEFNLYRPLGTGTDVYAIYGAQLESSTSYPTSYIPTQGASSTTRLQDIATNSGNASLINSEEGVLYAEISALADDGFQKAISIYKDGSLDNVITIQYNSISNNIRYLYRQGVVSVSDLNFVVNDIKNNHKIAATWKQNEFKLFIDGIKVGEQLSGNIAPLNTFVNLDFKRPDGHNFYGKNKALAVYKTALTDASLRSLTYPPAVATTFDLNFNTIADDFTFTRGSEATFVNSQGLIQSTASNDAPRLDYSTGAEAFLLEPQSTNLVTYSSDFSQIENYNSTITINNNVSPDGNINGNLWLANATASAKELQELYTVTNGTTYTESWFVKYKSQQFIQLVTTSATFGAFYGNFDLINGTKESGSFTDFSIEPYLNGWYRISATQVATSSGSGRLAGLRMIESATAPRGGNITTTGTEAVEVWGHQSEALSYQTSYIPTSGASATRNQELCNNATPVINSEEGTLYAEISSLADDQTNRIISLSDGTGNNQVLILYQLGSNILRVGFQVANQTDIVIDVNTNTTLISKIAVNYNSTSVKLYLNGSKVGETSTGYTFSSNVLDNLSFSYGSGILPFFGNTKDLKYYPKALADVQLQDLTSWGSFTEMANALNYTIK